MEVIFSMWIAVDISSDCLTEWDIPVVYLNSYYIQMNSCMEWIHFHFKIIMSSIVIIFSLEFRRQSGDRKTWSSPCHSDGSKNLPDDHDGVFSFNVLFMSSLLQPFCRYLHHLLLFLTSASLVSPTRDSHTSDLIAREDQLEKSCSEERMKFHSLKYESRKEMTEGEEVCSSSWRIFHADAVWRSPWRQSFHYYLRYYIDAGRRLDVSWW